MHILQALSFIPKRLFRLIVPIALVVILSSALSTLFILYHAPRAPGRIQKLSWQKWDVVTVNPNGIPLEDATAGNGGTGEKEWWQLDEQDAGDAPAGTSLPLDVWSPLLPHSTGLTEIAIRPCLVSPDFVDFCAPKTTPEEDALKGKWVRVEKDLNLKTGMWYLNIYYRRTRRLDVPLVTDIRLLRSNESISDLPGSEHSWVKASGDLHDGLYPSEPALYLYYQIRKPLAGIPQSMELRELVTEIDVLYGLGDRVMWGFEKANIPVVEGNDGSKARDAVWITFRKGMSRPPRAPPLHFNDNGTFKILQVADLHYSVDEGECRDTDVSALPDFIASMLLTKPCKGDTITRTLLARELELEKPDLVVFTGDQLNGQHTSWDASSVMMKAVGEVIDAKIPWAAIFGNHDSEHTDLTRSEQMKVLTRMPYAVREMEAGPQWVDGVGNWLVKVRSADNSATHILTLYFLDSHAYAESGWTFWKPAEYDWLKQTQIDWFLEQSASIAPIERPFQPGGAKDLGKVWLRQEDPPQLRKPNALMFFHIPLPESYDPADVTVEGTTLNFGDEGDAYGAPTKNSGFFGKGLLKAMDTDGPGAKNEVKIVANGHCHISDFCKRVMGVWLCFGGGSSFAGYGKIGFDRRFRVYEVSDYGETIRTYKRTQDGSIVGDTILVGHDAVGRK